MRAERDLAVAERDAVSQDAVRLRGEKEALAREVEAAYVWIHLDDEEKAKLERACLSPPVPPEAVLETVVFRVSPAGEAGGRRLGR